MTLSENAQGFLAGRNGVLYLTQRGIAINLGIDIVVRTEPFSRSRLNVRPTALDDRIVSLRTDVFRAYNVLSWAAWFWIAHGSPAQYGADPDA